MWSTFLVVSPSNRRFSQIWTSNFGKFHHNLRNTKAWSMNTIIWSWKDSIQPESFGSIRTSNDNNYVRILHNGTAIRYQANMAWWSRVRCWSASTGKLRGETILNWDGSVDTVDVPRTWGSKGSQRTNCGYQMAHSPRTWLDIDGDWQTLKCEQRPHGVKLVSTKCVAS